jgi:hypothetical protein
VAVVPLSCVAGCGGGCGLAGVAVSVSGMAYFLFFDCNLGFIRLYFA